MTDYYEENIEYVTEQTIEQEIRDDIEEIRANTVGDEYQNKIGDINQIKQEGLDGIEEIRIYTVGKDGDAGEVDKIKDNALSYIEDQKNNLVSYGDDKIEYANQTYGDIVQINENTDAIAENTIAEIEYNIREMIVNNGYVMKITDDGNGNADIVLVKEAGE